MPHGLATHPSMLKQCPIPSSPSFRQKNGTPVKTGAGLTKSGVGGLQPGGTRSRRANADGRGDFFEGRTA